MMKSHQWYLSWQPGVSEYDHDDTILAVGLQCVEAAIPLRDVLNWLGAPDRVTGNGSAGHILYFFEAEKETAALFDVVDRHVDGFGTITRDAHNAIRQDGTTVNIFDTMESYSGSEMKSEAESGGE